MVFTVNTGKMQSPIVLQITHSNINANKYEKCSKATCLAPELGLVQELLEPCDGKIINVSCARRDHDNQNVFIEFQGRSRSASASAKSGQKLRCPHEEPLGTNLHIYFAFVMSHCFYFMDKLLSFVQQSHCIVVPGVLSYKR